ncbi:MAG: hypothetical protein NTV00_16335 [Methylococcales bacterium]|nr:hypothetical protein [Methylococcales bacterium]
MLAEHPVLPTFFKHTAPQKSRDKSLQKRHLSLNKQHPYKKHTLKKVDSFVSGKKSVLSKCFIPKTIINDIK